MPKITIETRKGVADVDYRFKKDGRLEYRLNNAEKFNLTNNGFEYLSGAEMDKDRLMWELIDWVRDLVYQSE